MTGTEGNLVELLTRLAAEYRHYQQEHEREPVDRPTRRVLHAKVSRLGERFEQVVGQWVDDEALRERWVRYLYKGGDPPEGPRIATPPEFRGVTDAGTRVEIRACEDGGYDLVVDGRLERHETVPWHLDPDMIEPIQIGEYACREIFAAPPAAVEALAAFMRAPGSEPPWPWARALLEDGLVDSNFSLRPRGRRRLSGGAPQPAEHPAYLTFGVLAADGARARVFVLGASDGEQVPTVAPLVEVSHTTSPDRRAKDSELFADAPGMRREGPHSPRGGMSDRREGHRRDSERRFAAQVVDEAERAFREHAVTRVVLVASPAMLGVLRPLMHHEGHRPWTVRELARDLSRLAAPALHDALAEDGLLPPRGRLPSTRATPGVPLQ
jgi:protein required for attachment to host cells